jgi:hypothetical protein
MVALVHRIDRPVLWDSADGARVIAQEITQRSRNLSNRLMHSVNEAGNIGIRPGNRWHRKREAKMCAAFRASDQWPAL